MWKGKFFKKYYIKYNIREILKFLQMPLYKNLQQFQSFVMNILLVFEEVKKIVGSILYTCSEETF